LFACLSEIRGLYGKRKNHFCWLSFEDGLGVGREGVVDANIPLQAKINKPCYAIGLLSVSVWF
jgi:hypothetical protein